MNEKIKERARKVKAHFQRNKKTYVVSAGTAVVAVLGTVLVVNRKGDALNSAKAIGFIANARATTNHVTIELIEKSTPSKPVHLKGTDRYFSSISEAARETGHSVSMISRQVNGHIPDVGGDVFELLKTD